LDNEKKIELFINKMKMNGFSQNTLNGYALDVRLFFESVNKNWIDVTSDDLELFFGNLMDKRSKRTVARRMASVKAFYKYVCEKDEDFKDPTRKLKTPKLDKTLPKYLTSEEESALIESANSVRDRAILLMLYITGMRISELWALNKEDIDFETKRIKVYGKGGKERFVFINNEVCELLKQYFNERTDNDPALFADKYGNRLSRRSVQKFTKRCGQKAGIKKKVTPHCQRHTHATTMLRAGIPLEVIQQDLGHSQLATTLLYAKLNDTAVCDAHENVFGK
jgi:integrase/recombinase XerD